MHVFKRGRERVNFLTNMECENIIIGLSITRSVKVSQRSFKISLTKYMSKRYIKLNDFEFIFIKILPHFFLRTQLVNENKD